MKYKWLAAALNIIPGAGYLYLGVRIPFAIILLMMLPVTIFVAYADPNLSSSSTSNSSLSWGIVAMLAVPMIAFMVDAFNETGRVNALKSSSEAQKLPVPTKAPKAAAAVEITPFIVGVPKFVILSMITFSVYTIYWFYKNWQAVKASEKSNINPVWRALLGVIFLYSLLESMQRMLARHDDKADLSCLDRTVVWVGFGLASYVWWQVWLLDLVKPFALMGVQKKVNQVYASGLQPSNRLTLQEWKVTLFGILIAILNIWAVWTQTGH